MRALFLFLLSIGPACAQPAEYPFRLCEAGIAAAETGSAVPPGLLTNIARVESGRRDAAGRGRAWPWTINVNGTGHFFDTKDEAIAAVRAHQARGERSIDVGCMQVNLYYHPGAFATLEEAFDPGANARYAERFLSDLQARFRTWPLATAAYHSQEQVRGEDYQRMVYGLPPILRTPTIPLNLAGPLDLSAQPPAYSAFPPVESQFGAFAPNRRMTLTLLPGGPPLGASTPPGRATFSITPRAGR